MKKIKLSSVSLLLFLSAVAQEDLSKIRDSILSEAKKLYRSESASWNGTDIFLQNYKGAQNNIGGYFSYADDENEVCVFFSASSTPLILGTIVFDKNDKVTFDTTQRQFTNKEKDYYSLREAAYKEVNSDTAFFKTYKNTSLNLVPFIEGDKRVIYVLTGTGSNDIVIFGNDYFLTFDQSNKLVSKKSLHKNIIVANYSKSDKEEGPAHTHLPETGNFITATDLCTTMLYQGIAKWKQNMVVSEKYMSIWNCKENVLAIIPYR